MWVNTHYRVNVTHSCSLKTIYFYDTFFDKHWYYLTENRIHWVLPQLRTLKDNQVRIHNTGRSITALWSYAEKFDVIKTWSLVNPWNFCTLYALSNFRFFWTSCSMKSLILSKSNWIFVMLSFSGSPMCSGGTNSNNTESSEVTKLLLLARKNLCTYSGTTNGIVEVTTLVMNRD